MNTPELSIIIPVYQAKSFLKNCVESILNQEYQDYELLLIDDGSTDGSEMICDEYANEDHRILVFHQPNKGVSAARNLGLDHARGEYNCFFSITYGYQYNARTGSAAYRWQPEMLTCYEKTFDAIRNLLRKFDVSNTEEDNVMRSEIINAYSSFLYNLCLPSCKLNLLQKRKLAQQARKKFQVKRYLKLYSTANSSLFDKAKLLLYEPIWRVC